MKKTLKLTIILTIILGIFTHCQNEHEEFNIGNASLDTNNIDSANIIFSKILANAVLEKDIRIFLKEEGSYEIDNDYDVIYHYVKNKKLNSGKTFREHLSRYCKGINYLDSITNIDPTLSILIPFIDDRWNIETWDINSEIPDVAYRNSQIKRNSTKISVFGSNNITYFLSRYENPQKQVLVVKSNERLIPAKNNLRSSSINQNNELKSENEIFAYFSDNEFNKKTNTTKAVNLDNTEFEKTQRAYYAYCYNVNSNRDYIYYGIDPLKNINTGPFLRDYAEHIVEIRFNTPTSYYNVTDRYSPTGDWTEGNLEFHCDFIFIKKNGASESIRKVLSIPINQLFKINSNLATNATDVLTYKLKNPVEIFTWDYFEYGDRYKLSLTEFDRGTEITTSTTISSSYTSNFSIDPSVDLGIVKIGAKAGISTTDTKSNTLTIKTTDNSDNLGEAYVSFFDPVFSGAEVKLNCYGHSMKTDVIYTVNNSSASNRDGIYQLPSQLPLVDATLSYYTGYKEYNTGSVSIVLAPRRK